MNREQLIDVAWRIARRVAGQALWDGDLAGWNVEAFDRAAPGGRSTQVASGTVYQGTAGIALFLGEAYGATGDAELARAAEGGIRHALADGAGLPPWSFGLHNGRAGIAWVAVRLADLLDRPEHRGAALDLLAPLAGHEPRDPSLDVISGAAGAIPVLLDLGRRLGRADLLGMAERLGDRLLAAARREPDGWSWGTVGASATRYLAGYAHGAAGIGVALLELARATGRGDLRFGAEMAFLYERGLFDPAARNWPDLRHQDLNLLIYSADPDAVRKALAAGTIPPYRPRFMSAWCHGAPGIALSRLRAFELNGEALDFAEARLALATTRAALAPSEHQTFSLCHGVAGNCEPLLYAAELLGEPALRRACEAAALAGWESFERPGRPWPCGTVDQVTDPSLMLGESGIGWFYLRLALPGIPSILLPRPAPVPAAELPAEDGGFAAAGRRAVDESFGGTLAAFAALGLPEPRLEPAPASGGPLATSPVTAAYRALRRAIARRRGALRARLDDAFRLERERYELAAVPNDLTVAWLRGLERAPAEVVAWDGARLGPAPDVRLVTTRWDPERLAARPDAAAPAGEADDEEDEEAAWIVARQGDRLVTRRASPFAAAVLAALEPPATVAEVARRLAGESGAPAPALAPLVREQAAELYRAGFLDEIGEIGEIDERTAGGARRARAG